MNEYKNLLLKVLENGVEIDDRTGVGTLRLIDDSTLTFDLKKGFPIVTGKKTFWKTAFSEFLWMLSGSTNLNDTTESVKKWWNAFDKSNNGDMGFGYGYQFRHNNALNMYDETYRKSLDEEIVMDLAWKDQLLYTLQQLKDNPYSRRHIMTLWNSVQMDYCALPSCHGTVIQFFVNPDGTLDCKTYQRSADIFIGLNHNIIQYALLTHIFADILDLRVGRLIYTFGDLHLYKNHVDAALEYLKRESFPLPQLKINRKLTEKDLSLNNFTLTLEDFELIVYNSHPAIKAEMAI